MFSLFQKKKEDFINPLETVTYPLEWLENVKEVGEYPFHWIIKKEKIKKSAILNGASDKNDSATAHKSVPQTESWNQNVS